MKYRKKPIVIEAFRFGYDTPPKWFLEADGHTGDVYDNFCIINTLEGSVVAKIGDWIIKGIEGELYPCKHEIFIQTYEPVE